jgi:integrase
VEVERGKRYRIRVPISYRPLRQKTETFHGTKAQAEARRAEMMREARRLLGQTPDERETEDRKARREAERSARTFGEVLDAWLTASEARRKPSTLREYRRLVPEIRAHLGHLFVTDLEPEDLDAFYSTVKLGDRSIKARVDIVGAALTFAQRQGWIDRNAARLTEPLRGSKSKALEVPTPDQARRLIEQAETDGEVVGMVVRLAAHVGLRRGELVALRWSAIDLDTEPPTLRVVANVTAGDAALGQIGTPKSEASTRALALAAEDAEALRQYRAWQQAEATRHGVTLDPDPYVLTWAKDGATYAEPSSLSHAVQRVCDALRNPGEPFDYSLQALRHYAATQLIAGGVDPVTAARRTGHDPAVLLRVYAAAVPALDVKAAEVVANAS